MTASVKFEDGKTTKNATLQGVYDETVSNLYLLFTGLPTTMKTLT